MKKFIFVVALFAAAFTYRYSRDILIPRYEQRKAINEYLDRQTKKYAGKPEPSVDSCMMYVPSNEK